MKILFAGDINFRGKENLTGGEECAKILSELKPYLDQVDFYLMSDYGEIVCGHTVVADGGDNNATL